MERAVLRFGCNGAWHETPENAGKELAAFVRPGDIVLLKGSRGMRMEKAMESVEKDAAGDKVFNNTEGRI
jgi:UDP-N-acetylmuramyl pentapeptide synthase